MWCSLYSSVEKTSNYNMRISILLMTILFFGNCKPKEKAQPIQKSTTATAIASDNSLSEQEIKDGWKLLFDGETISQWHKYNSEGLNKNWEVTDGTISFNPENEDGGDLTSNEEYENFEFSMDWKIAKCGNSGIMWNVQESEDYQYPWLTGPEMQILDNSCHPDAKIIKHRAGDLYDLIECSEVTVKDAGQWNTIKIVSNQGKMQFWQNGINVVSFEMHNPNWDDMVANSKFKDMPAFGKFKKGKIVLQDHTDPVSFKNIKIKTL